MDLQAFFKSCDNSAGLEDEGEGEAVRVRTAPLEHLFEEKDGFFRWAFGERQPSDHGIPGEGVGIGHLGEQEAGVIGIPAGGENSGEDSGKEVGFWGGEEGGCEEVSVDLAECFDVWAFLEEGNSEFFQFFFSSSLLLGQEKEGFWRSIRFEFK